MIRSVPWAPVAALVESTYGVEQRAFGHFGFWQIEGECGAVWIAPAGFHHPGGVADLQNWGWPVLTARPPEGLATGDLLKMIGADATRNVVELNAEQRETLASEGKLDPATWADLELTTPHLAVRRGHLALGGVDANSGAFLPPKWFR